MSLVDQHPLVQAVDAQLADLEERRLAFEDRVRPLAEADAEDEARYQAALSKALLEGGPTPERPERRLPPLDTELALRNGFFDERRRLGEERQKAIADARDDVLLQARREANKVIRAARPTVEKLVAQMGELADLLSAAKVARDARNQLSPERHHYQDGHVSVEAFIKLAAAGGDPLIALVDLRGLQPDTGERLPNLAVRDIGMTSGDIQALLTPAAG